MQRIDVQTAQNVRISYAIASVGDRILAFLLDVILLFLISWGLSLLINQAGMADQVLSFMFLLPVIFYHLIFEIFFNGQSLGKMALNIKVVMMDGSQPTLGALILRWIFRVLEITATTGAGALIAILISGKGQRLGDMAAGTTVVKLQAPGAIKRHELIKKQQEDHVVTFHDVDQLNDTDIAIILEALKTYKNTGNKQPVTAAARKVKEVLGVTSELADLTFLYTVVRDYNFLTSIS